VEGGKREGVEGGFNGLATANGSVAKLARLTPASSLTLPLPIPMPLGPLEQSRS